MIYDPRLIYDIRGLVKQFPKAKFIGQDLLDIINNETVNVYDRLGDVTNAPLKIETPSSDINKNKNNIIGKVVVDRSFKESHGDGKAWAKRINKIKNDLGLPRDANLQVLRKELSNIIVDENSANLNQTDINYLLSVLKQ